MSQKVIKRGSSWTIRYYIGKDENGKWKEKWESGFPTKKEAERVLRQRIEAVECGNSKNLSRITLRAFLRKWLESCSQQGLAPNTLRGYTVNMENHVIPYFGDCLLIQLKPTDLEMLYSKLKQQGLSNTSIRYVHNNLHKAFDYGIRLQMLPRNPTDMVIPPRVDRFEASTLSPAQVVTLLDACKNAEVFWPILLAVTLGLRRGEALGLRWEDVDLDARRITITHSALCNSKDGFTISETKTPSGRRPLMLPDYVAEMLKHRLDILADRREQFGEGYNEMNLVCFRELGGPLTTNALQHQFNKVLLKAGLPKVRFHDLRHTNATLLLRNGISPKIVSSMLGHSGIQVTMDRYSHVAPDMQEGAVHAMDQICSRVASVLEPR